MLKEVFLLPLLLLMLLASVSESQLTSLLPHANESFNISYRRMRNTQTCSYWVVISTSCSSPRYTRDRISIAFGSTYDTQIYAPRLDHQSLGAFENCSSDTFKITGVCTYQMCYLYLYRSGSDGWKPESVKVGGLKKIYTFYYNTLIPRDTWYGIDLCNDAASSYRVIAYKWMMFVLLGLVLTFWL